MEVPLDAPNLSRAHLIQGTRIMRFEEVYEGWRQRRLSQSEAAEILGVCERSFRRYAARYEDSEGDLNSLADKRLSQVSKRKAAVGEIDALIALYHSRFIGWNLTQVGRACKQWGIEHIAAYSPQARGRSERAFRTHQDRLVKELAQHGITAMQEANVYLEQTYRAQHNAEFARTPAGTGSAFVPYVAQGHPSQTTAMQGPILRAA